MNDTLLDSFSKSRAEEYPADLWNRFVIPPGYKDSKCLFKYKRAVMIEGGRGSGKTMFLKYHCHKTRFSKQRASISAIELEHIGLYFRPDTDFCAMINLFNFSDQWEKVFKHYICINILQEFYSAIKTISETTFIDHDISNDIMNLNTPKSLVTLIKDFPNTYGGLEDFCDYLSTEFNLWLNDVDSFSQPTFLEPRTVINNLINELSKLFGDNNSICFYVYFDEFENLNADQQRIINTWMKHVQPPLIFNVAYKKGAKVSRETVSSERLVLRNDYRVVDLEDITPKEFKVFAAEVLCLKLMEKIKFEGCDQVKRCLSDEEFIAFRGKEDYQRTVLDTAKHFLPSVTYKEIAENIMSTDTLKNRIERFLIKPTLHNSGFQSSDFICADFPEESLINGFLLNRKSHSTKTVHDMFGKLKSGQNRDAYKGLVEQNLVGGILWVYLSASWKKCPVFAGFDRYCLLSRENMRHFLELCHQALSVASRKQINLDSKSLIPMSADIQSEASSNSSRLELVKIDELGKYGENLRFIVNRLGLFFQLLQKRKSQSETEVNHFSLKISDTNKLDITTKTLLEEAILWSILIETEGDTKRKGANDSSSKEYMLHPIFSPHFGISFRRKKKFEFTQEQIKIIFSGSESEYLELRSKFSRKWELPLPDKEFIDQGDFEDDIQRGLWDC